MYLALPRSAANTEQGKRRHGVQTSESVLHQVTRSSRANTTQLHSITSIIASHRENYYSFHFGCPTIVVTFYPVATSVRIPQHPTHCLSDASLICCIDHSHRPLPIRGAVPAIFAARSTYERQPDPKAGSTVKLPMETVGTCNAFAMLQSTQHHVWKESRVEPVTLMGVRMARRSGLESGRAGDRIHGMSETQM